MQQQQQSLLKAQIRLQEAYRQQQQRQELLAELEQTYQGQQRSERPTSRLAQARQRCQAVQKRCHSREKALLQPQKKLIKLQAQVVQQQNDLAELQTRLAQFEQDNQTNRDPVEMEIRLDAGFGTYENLALLIEMGYELYTKPYNHKFLSFLKSQITPQTQWTRVGDNAEMIAWSELSLKRCPYSLNVALERFYTGKTLKYSALLHFGADPVTQD